MQTTDTTAREIERTYEVALTGDTIVNVRLTYPIGDEPRDRLGEQARTEAIRRAVKLRRKANDTREFDTDCAGIDVLRERLVTARPVDGKALAQLEAKSTRYRPSKQNRTDKTSASRSNNGWVADPSAD